MVIYLSQKNLIIAFFNTKPPGAANEEYIIPRIIWEGDFISGDFISRPA